MKKSRLEWFTEWFIIDFRHINKWSYLKFASFTLHILVNMLMIASTLEWNFFTAHSSPNFCFDWQLVMGVSLLTFPLGLLVQWIKEKEKEEEDLIRFWLKHQIWRK